MDLIRLFINDFGVCMVIIFKVLLPPGWREVSSYPHTQGHKYMPCYEVWEASVYEGYAPYFVVQYGV